MSTVHQPSAARRRGQRLWVLLRPCLTGVTLVVILFLPLNRQGSIPLLLIGLVALTALVVWQIRAVTTSPSPRLRAAESLATSIPLYIVLFAVSHATMSSWDADAFTEPLDRTDALYFTITTLATVGFGDIAPVSQFRRIVVMVQMVTGLVLLGLVIKMFLSAVEVGLRNAEGEPADQTEADGPARDHVDGEPTTADGPEPGTADRRQRPRRPVSDRSELDMPELPVSTAIRWRSTGRRARPSARYARRRARCRVGVVPGPPPGTPGHAPGVASGPPPGTPGIAPDELGFCSSPRARALTCSNSCWLIAPESSNSFAFAISSVGLLPATPRIYDSVSVRIACDAS